MPVRGATAKRYPNGGPTNDFNNTIESFDGFTKTISYQNGLSFDDWSALVGSQGNANQGGEFHTSCTLWKHTNR
jgi:hypothetical protein